MTMVQRGFSGDYGYRADFVGDSLAGRTTGPGSRRERQNPFCSLTGTPLSSNRATLEVAVGDGVPFLFGFATTESGGYPSGARTVLRDNRGAVVGPDTADPGSRIVVYERDNVSVFLIADPDPGTWTMTVDDLGSDAYAFLSTLPSQDAYASMFDAIAPHIEQDVVDAADGVGTCWACRIVCWGVATALAALVAAGPDLLTAVSAPAAAAVAVLAGTQAAMSPASVALIVQALTAAGATTAAILVLNFCTWLTACGTSTSCALDQPAAGERLTGQVKLLATAPGADSVIFLIDGTALGTGASAPYQLAWNTARSGNGRHTLVAVAVQGAESAMSTPVPVAVLN